LPERAYRQLTFAHVHRARCNLEKPRSFSEKVNWRILYDRRPELEWTCDKLSMKEHVAALGVDVVVPEVLWYGKDVRELAETALDGRWILKPNHASGRLLVFGEGRVADTTSLEAKMAGWLRDEQGRVLREWAYKKARRLLLVERLVKGMNPRTPPLDYKFFVFKGVVGLIQIDVGRFERHTRSLYTRDWKRRAWTLEHPPAGDIDRPPNLEAMIAAAEAIGWEYDFIRVDLYTDGEAVFFGEVTPYPGSGLERFCPADADHELGGLWTLPDLAARSSKTAS